LQTIPEISDKWESLKTLRQNSSCRYTNTAK